MFQWLGISSASFLSNIVILEGWLEKIQYYDMLVEFQIRAIFLIYYIRGLVTTFSSTSEFWGQINREKKSRLQTPEFAETWAVGLNYSSIVYQWVLRLINRMKTLLTSLKTGLKLRNGLKRDHEIISQK